MVDFPHKEVYNAEDFRRLTEVLRGEGGCPWDRAQTHASLRRYLLEECAELCEAIDEDSTEHMREELGDVLWQVLLHADIERERGTFDLDDVADTACKKLIGRHPHVFGGADPSASWEDLKRSEKGQETTAQALDSVCRTLPALWRSEKLMKKARHSGFDPADPAAVSDLLISAAGKLAQAVSAGEPTAVSEALGALLFSAVSAASFTRTDPEAALHAECERYIARIRSEETALPEET